MRVKPGVSALVLLGLLILLAAVWSVFGVLIYESISEPRSAPAPTRSPAYQAAALAPVDREPVTPSENGDPVPGSAFHGTVPFQAVVQLVMLYEQGGKLVPTWVGSGTVISPDGLILTNAHVALPDTDQVRSLLQIAFTFEQDKPPVPLYLAQVLQADPELDIAVVRPYTDLEGDPVDLSLLRLPYVALGNSDLLQLGDALTVLGYPGIGGDTITLTKGYVGGFTPDDKYGDRAFIKTSAAIAGGNSGGLAANDAGDLVGVPSVAGFGDYSPQADVVDCRSLADTNSDGVIDEKDSCVPVGGFINALRPVNLAIPLIEAAKRGEIAVPEVSRETSQPAETTDIFLWDDFSDASFTESHWVSQAGTWVIDQGVLRCAANGKLLVGDSSWGDYVFAVDVLGVDVVDKIIPFRFQNPSHSYGIDFRSDPYNDLVLVKTTPEHPNEILQTVHVPNFNNTWYTLGVIAVGNRILVTVNDRVVMDYVDKNAPILQGGVGVGAALHASARSAVYFDNALVMPADL